MNEIEKIEVSKNRLIAILIIEFILFIIFLMLLYQIFVLFYVGGSYSFYLYWYPFYFCFFLIWIKIFTKRKLKNFILGPPKKVMSEHSLIPYYIFMVFLIGIFITWILIILLTNIASFPPRSNQSDIPPLGMLILHSLILGPIVEEIIYRGYFYDRCEEIFNHQKFRNTQMTTAALISSILFGLSHLNIIQVIYVPILGLMFCKFRNDTNSLIPAICAHALVNLLGVFIAYTINLQIFSI